MKPIRSSTDLPEDFIATDPLRRLVNVWRNRAATLAAGRQCTTLYGVADELCALLNERDSQPPHTAPLANPHKGTTMPKPLLPKAKEAYGLTCDGVSMLLRIADSVEDESLDSLLDDLDTALYRIGRHLLEDYSVNLKDPIQPL